MDCLLFFVISSNVSYCCCAVAAEMLGPIVLGTGAWSNWQGCAEYVMLCVLFSFFQLFGGGRHIVQWNSGTAALKK